MGIACERRRRKEKSNSSHRISKFNLAWNLLKINMKTIFFILGAIFISCVTSSVISAAFKSFATRHHHMNKRAVSEQEFIRRQEKFAETMKMVSSLGRFRALGPEPRSDDVPFEEFLNDLGLPHGNLFHNHETVSDEDLGTVIEEGLEALEKNLGMAMEEGLEALEEITPLTDESIPFSELPTFDVAQGENETDVLEDSSLTDVANETQENSTEEGPKVKDLGTSEIVFDQEVSKETLETETDIANKTQDNSEE